MQLFFWVLHFAFALSNKSLWKLQIIKISMKNKTSILMYLRPGHSCQSISCCVWNIAFLYESNSQLLVKKHSYGWQNKSNDYHWKTSKKCLAFSATGQILLVLRMMSMPASTWGTVTCLCFFRTRTNIQNVKTKKGQIHNLYFTTYQWTKIDFYFPMLYVQ